MAPSTFLFLNPTLIDPYAAATGYTSSVCPDWVLLHKSPRICDSRNATTAECHTKEGQAVEVSFWLVDPPGVSYFSVHCPGLKENDFYDEPLLICADAALVLFSLTINVPHWRSTYYLVYRAGPGKPSLRLLPNVPDFGACNFGILPCGEEHYAVASFSRARIPGDYEAWNYVVHVFSSEAWAWSSKPAVVSISKSDKASLYEHIPSKQITVGSTSLGWVDLMQGILLISDLFNKNPIIKFITFPQSRVCITDEDGDLTIAPEYVFDVASCNDLIKFVEMQFDIPYDRNSSSGWRATTWNWKISCNGWCKRSTVDIAKVSVDRCYHALLPELWGDKAQQPDLKKLNVYTPTLSMKDDDCVYIMSKVNHEDDMALVISLDMKHAVLEALGTFSIEGCYHVTMFFTSAFPKYLSVTPGADMTNPVGDYTRMRGAHSVQQVKLTQEWFRKLDQCLEYERTYNRCISLLPYGPLPSLHNFKIRALVHSYNGQGKAATKAVDFFFRALEDFNLVVRKSPSESSTSIEAIRSKITVVLQALDNILEVVPPRVMVRGTVPSDACGQKRRQVISEYYDEPGHTEDCKLDFPVAKLLNCNKSRRRRNRTYKRQQGTLNQSRDWKPSCEKQALAAGWNFHGWPKLPTYSVCLAVFIPLARSIIFWILSR